MDSAEIALRSVIAVIITAVGSVITTIVIENHLHRQPVEAVIIVIWAIIAALIMFVPWSLLFEFSLDIFDNW